MDLFCIIKRVEKIVFLEANPYLSVLFGRFGFDEEK